MGSTAELGSLKSAYKRSSVVFNASIPREGGRNPRSPIRNVYDSPMLRVFTKALAVIVALAAVLSAATWAYLRRSLPVLDGVVTVNGVSAPVDIVRDRDAIPHIFASTKVDALFGLGYAHAQDRLWQMEFQRRIGHGRLSEILGPPAVPQDPFLRTRGFTPDATPPV